MKRWVDARSERAEVPEVEALLVEIAAVCKKHGLSLSHEDGHGGFQVEEWNQYCEDWLLEASDSRNGHRRKGS